MIETKIKKKLSSILPFHRYVRDIELGLFKDFSFKGVVLDAGCGNGDFASRLMDDRSDIVGVDLSIDELRKAKGKYGNLVLCDLNHLPFRRESVNLEICNSVLEHISSYDKVLGEFSDALVKGGRVLFTLPIPQESMLLNRVSETMFSYYRISIIDVLSKLIDVDIRVDCFKPYCSKLFHKIYLLSMIFIPLLMISPLIIRLIRPDGRVQVSVFIGGVKF